MGVKCFSVGRAELQLSLVRMVAPPGRAKARAYRRWSYGAFRPFAHTPTRRHLSLPFRRSRFASDKAHEAG
jgi:hypothetical protein